MKKASVVAAFVLGCGATASLAWTAADDHPGKKLVDQKIAKMTAPEAMQKWMQNGQPSLGHEVLAQFEGGGESEDAGAHDEGVTGGVGHGMLGAIGHRWGARVCLTESPHATALPRRSRAPLRGRPAGALSPSADG